MALTKVKSGLVDASFTSTLPSKEDIIVTNLRMMLNTAVSSGALMQGYQWELGSDEWATGSSNYSLTSSAPNYYYGPGPIKSAYSYTGSDQTFVVPAGVTSLNVKLWGAGGGSSIQTSGSGNADYGGGGGFVSGTLAVTPGETLTFVVGQAGAANAGTRYGGGGAAGSNGGGSGGGRSAIRRGTADIVTAGAGGGAGNSGNAALSGGVGGGLTGGDGYSQYSTAYTGKGGTQSAGGAAGTGSGGNAYAGSQYAGGAGDTSGSATSSGTSGGGGGGYYGGGGSYGGGGGGGSSYVANLTGTVVNTQAPNQTAAGTGDADYVSGIGNGQMGGDLTGGNGRIVISYVSSTMTLQSPTVSATSAPSAMVAYFLWKDDSGSAVIGTDLIVELSRDNGATWTTATLTVVSSYDGNYSIIKARADVSTQPSGTQMKARIKAMNAKAQRVAAVALYKE